MAKLEVLAGTTSKMVTVFLQDSSSTTGAGLTGLVFNTASLTAYYYREGAGSATSITLQTMTLGTWATGGFIVVDGTNMPGVYSIGLPNAAIAAGAKSVTVYIKGATNLMPSVLEIELTATDNQDAVRYGLTALPNVASGSAGAIPTTGTGANQLSVSSGQVILQTGTGTGQLDFTSGVVKANATQLLGGTIPAPNVTGVPLVDLKYTLGTISPATAGSVRADAVTGAVGSVTGNVGGNVVGSVASVTAVSANAIGATSISSAGLNAIADGVLDRNMATGTDSGTDSTAVRTPRQALRASRNKVAIAAGSLDVKKEDDVTSSWTAVIGTSAGNPISSIDPTD